MLGLLAHAETATFSRQSTFSSIVVISKEDDHSQACSFEALLATGVLETSNR